GRIVLNVDISRVALNRLGRLALVKHQVVEGQHILLILLDTIGHSASSAISTNAPEKPKTRSLRLCDRIDPYEAHVRRHRELARPAQLVANVDLAAIGSVEHDGFWRKVIGDRFNLVWPSALGHIGVETRLLSRCRNEPHAAAHISAADV